MNIVTLLVRRIGACLALCAMAAPLSVSASGNRAITFMQKGGWADVSWYQNDGSCLYLVGSVSSFENTSRMPGYVNPYALSYVSVEMYDLCTQTYTSYYAVDSTELMLGASGARHARVSGVVPASSCVTAPNRPIECRIAALSVDLRWNAYEAPTHETNAEHNYETGIGMYSYRFTGSYARAEVSGQVLDGGIPLFLLPVRSGQLRDSQTNSVTINSNH